MGKMGDARPVPFSRSTCMRNTVSSQYSVCLHCRSCTWELLWQIVLESYNGYFGHNHLSTQISATWLGPEKWHLLHIHKLSDHVEALFYSSCRSKTTAWIYRQIKLSASSSWIWALYRHYLSLLRIWVFLSHSLIHQRDESWPGEKEIQPCWSVI